MSPNLMDLITELDAENPEADALSRVSAAQRRAHSLADLGEQLVGHYVEVAKADGASWSQIGEAIGVSKQAAQQRWVPSVYERFTNRARHVVVLAQEQARTLKHDRIGTEHLLLGLLGEPDGLAMRVLGELAGSADAVRAAVAAVPGDSAVPQKIPFTPDGKEALGGAARAAADLGHNFVGTEHLLLGLLDVPDSRAAAVLAELGVTRAEVAGRVSQFLAGYLAAMQRPVET
jgi:uncharacterized protein YdbL (DUF1318 family)